MNEFCFFTNCRLDVTHFHVQMIARVLRWLLAPFFFFAHAHYALFSKRKGKYIFVTHQAGTEANDGGVVRFSVHVSFIKTVPIHCFALILVLVRSVPRAKDRDRIKRRNKSCLERQVQVIVPTESGESVMHVPGFPVSRFRVLIGAPLPAFEVRAHWQRVPVLGHSDWRHDLVRSGVLQWCGCGWVQKLGF